MANDRLHSESRWASRIVAGCAIALLAGVVWHSGLLRAEVVQMVPAPKVDDAKAAGPPHTAVISGGCFWGIQGVFQHVKGVTRAVSGYAGGDKSTAEYETVSTGTTGHAESVQITYDPAQVTYGELLQIAFSVGFDPTELNRQGPDTGTQYRSELWYSNDQQKNIATAYIAQLNQAHAFSRQIVTRVDPLRGFYAAEAYHQDYLYLHPSQPYIAYNDIPKVNALKHIFPDIYLQQPTLVNAVNALKQR
jgi:peptide-methionine (S)-S-oxide reductase